MHEYPMITGQWMLLLMVMSWQISLHHATCLTLLLSNLISFIRICLVPFQFCIRTNVAEDVTRCQIKQSERSYDRAILAIVQCDEMLGLPAE